MKIIPPERLEYVERLYLSGRTDRAIQKATAAKYGIKPRQVRRYLERVKAKLAASVKAADPNADRAQVRGMLLRAFQVATAGGIHGPDAKAMVAAAKALAEVTGVAAPQRFEHSGPGGGPLEAMARVVVLPLLEPPHDPAAPAEPAAAGAVEAESGAAEPVPGEPG